MSRLVLREGDAPRLVRLAGPVADALAESGAVGVVPAADGLWEVAAGTQIGVIRARDLEVMIRPKIDIARLVFLMSYARNPRIWRDDPVHLDPAADLPQALAYAFARFAARALDQGLLKGYVTVDESLPVMRGRIREADQLRRRWGRAIPLELRYDEFSVDISENQLLLSAAERMLRLGATVGRTRSALQRVRLQLADVSPLRPGQPRPRWVPSRLNSRYVPALQLAELILDGRSFEQRVGELMVTGYLFNMVTIFEDFVTVALREALRPHGGRTVLQYRSHLDEAETVPIRPDLVWSEAGRPRIVVDAKYKAEKPSGFPQADLYQMHAYCTVLGLPVGHLVYAKGHELPKRHTVRGSGVQVVAHALDLASEPAQLLDSIQSLVLELVRSHRTS